MADCRIWVSYHKDELVQQFNLHDDDTHKLFATHNDVDGENINRLNPLFSEMVTMYYVWKNDIKTRYVGFEHYRRHLTVHKMPKKGQCQVYTTIDFGDETGAKHGGSFMSVYDQYAKCHNSSDLDLALSVIREKYGKDNGYEKYIRNEHVLISNCCFLMTWGDFVSLCEFLFPILEEFADKCGCGYDIEKWREKAMRDFGGKKISHQMRTISFLSERLISAWIWNNLSWYKTKDVLIIHYNTPELTKAAIRSLTKNTKGCYVYVFDNSDEKPFTYKIPNVEVIDNTKGQIIDFKKFLSQYPDKYPVDNDWASAKHCYTVHKCFELIPNGFVLMDSDVLIRQDISSLWDERYAFVAKVKRNVKRLGVVTNRMLPFLAYINVPLCDKFHATFFNSDRMYALTTQKPGVGYDTGSWFFECCDSKSLPYKEIETDGYMLHFGHASWRPKSDIVEWLKENEALWK